MKFTDGLEIQKNEVILRNGLKNDEGSVKNMSLLNEFVHLIKSLLPVSSRSFHGCAARQDQQHKKMLSRLETIRQNQKRQVETIGNIRDELIQQNDLLIQQNNLLKQNTDLLKQQRDELKSKVQWLQEAGVTYIDSRICHKTFPAANAFPSDHFLLMDYSYPGGYKTINVGDNIQTIALKNALQTLYPDCRFSWCDRENLINYDGEPVLGIYQGWFSHGFFNFLPSKKIDPVFLGTHFGWHARDAIQFLHEKSVSFKNYEIGCRDLSTQKFCDSLGIRSYFSRCLTLTLPKLTVPQTSDCFFVNVPEDLERFFPAEMQKNAIRINQNRIAAEDLPTHQQRFSYAEQLLSKYASASCVVTTAIHCAMPCLAMGVPVIFIDLQEDPLEFERFSVISGLLNRYTSRDLEEKKIDFSPEPVDLDPLKKLLLENLRISIQASRGKYDDWKSLNSLRREIAEFHTTSPLC